MQILYLKHGDIDKELWDSIISNSSASLPYAFSWYLDVVSPEWEALVTAGYEYIMPLPVKRKFLIKYLIQPWWVQQLGVFSSDNRITSEVVRAFVERIPYLLYDFNMNYLNYGCSERIRMNMLIECVEPIGTVRSRYSKNAVRNLEKAKSVGLDIDEISVDEFMKLWFSENVDKSEAQRFKLFQLVRTSMENNGGVLLGVKRNGRLIAGLFGIRTRDRFTYLAPVSDREGKDCRAMFLLVDYILENICCNHGLIFDCEGSMIDGVARFYKGFGAQDEIYYRISRGRPVWLFG